MLKLSKLRLIRRKRGIRTITITSDNYNRDQLHRFTSRESNPLSLTVYSGITSHTRFFSFYKKRRIKSKFSALYILSNITRILISTFLIINSTVISLTASHPGNRTRSLVSVHSGITSHTHDFSSFYKKRLIKSNFSPLYILSNITSTLISTLLIINTYLIINSTVISPTTSHPGNQTRSLVSVYSVITSHTRVFSFFL